MDPNNKNSQLGFSWPQWILKTANKRFVYLGDFGDLCLSPPMDDSDSFLKWSCMVKNNQIKSTSDVENTSNTANALVDSKGNPPMSVQITPHLPPPSTTLMKSSSTGNLVDRVKDLGLSSTTPLSTPGTTPVPSPQHSPATMKKRPYVPNPYFTEREVEPGKSWLFRGIRKPEGEVRDERSAMSTLKSMQPNELREMNLFCPLSM